MTTAQALQYYDVMTSGVGWVKYNITFSTTENELNDIVEVGNIGIAHQPIAYLWFPSDMDSATGAVHKITVGGTDIVTGLTGAQTGTSQMGPVTTLIATSTNPTKVQVQTTTAAATPVAGTATLFLLCVKVNY
jgi:hypothetical protein